MITARIPTANGMFTARFSERGLAQLEFPQAGKPPATSGLGHSTRSHQWLRQTEAALQCVLAGKKPAALPPLDLSSGTDFQRSVWNALKEIPTGETRSYSQIAEAVGRSKAVRAVGQACGANPIPVLIPCHRVLAANGGIGGFSSGLEWKRKLLACEGGLGELLLERANSISAALRSKTRLAHRSSPAAGRSHGD